MYFIYFRINKVRIYYLQSIICREYKQNHLTQKITTNEQTFVPSWDLLDTDPCSFGVPFIPVL